MRKSFMIAAVFVYCFMYLHNVYAFLLGQCTGKNDNPSQNTTSTDKSTRTAYDYTKSIRNSGPTTYKNSTTPNLGSENIMSH